VVKVPTKGGPSTVVRLRPDVYGLADGASAASPDDRLAEMWVRHHLGQYTGRVAARRDALMAAPLSQLEATTAALLKACDYLGVTRSQLEEANAAAEAGSVRQETSQATETTA